MLKTTHPPAGHASPGARALYLGTRDKKQVSCTEEALVVRNDRAQTLRYPVARVARVVTSTVVDWSGQALALCMRHGIGISWVDARGQALGTCYPCQRNPLPMAAALELWVETPAGPERYQHWVRTRRMDVLLRWGQAHASSISPALWELTKQEWVYGEQCQSHLPSALRSHVMAYVGSQLAALGAPPLLWGPEAQPVSLDEDLCTLLWAEMNLFTGTMADATQGDKDIVHLFERWTARNGAALVLHLNSLHRTAMKALHE